MILRYCRADLVSLVSIGIRSDIDARDEFGLDLARSYMIGDKFIDVECGWNAGVARSLLVRTGYGAETERKHAAQLVRAVIADDLPAAVEWILVSGQPAARLA